MVLYRRGIFPQQRIAGASSGGVLSTMLNVLIETSLILAHRSSLRAGQPFL